MALVLVGASSGSILFGKSYVEDSFFSLTSSPTEFSLEKFVLTDHVFQRLEQSFRSPELSLTYFHENALLSDSESQLFFFFLLRCRTALHTLQNAVLTYQTLTQVLHSCGRVERKLRKIRAGIHSGQDKRWTGLLFSRIDSLEQKLHRLRAKLLWYYGMSPLLSSSEARKLFYTPLRPWIDAERNALQATLTFASIQVSVLDAQTQQPISGAEVGVFFKTTGELVTISMTDANGEVTLSLPSGPYIIGVRTAGYIPEVYPDIHCNACDPRDQTPLEVLPNQSYAIAFELDKGGAISGTVVETSSGNPIANALVEVYDAFGNFVDEALTDSQGIFTTTDGFLESGTYYLRIQADGYITTVYTNVPCAMDQCSPFEGTPIRIVEGQITQNITVSLPTSGQIQGTIVDSATNAPIAQAHVLVYDANDNLVTETYTDSNGSYTAQTDLITGTYYAKAFTDDIGYISELYQNTTCPFGACTPSSGTPISVVQGASTTGIDFVLDKGGTLTGSLTDASTGQPVTSGFVGLYMSSINKGILVIPDANGNYVFKGLPTDTYYVNAVWNLDGYLEELYDNIHCNGWDCFDTTGATPVSVTQGSTVSGINFQLEPGGMISGPIRDQATNDIPYGYAYIDFIFFDQNGNYAGFGFVDDTGYFSNGPGLMTGNYFMFIDDDQAYYVDEVYQDYFCPGGSCLGAVLLIPVTEGSTTNISVTVDKGGTLTGFMGESVTYAPLIGSYVSVYDQTGTYLVDGNVTMGGNIVLADALPTGDYLITSFNQFNYTDEVYDNIPCNPSCPITSGTPVPVTLGQETQNIDFLLDSAALEPVSYTWSEISGNNNGVVEPYETIELVPSWTNVSTSSFTSVTGSLFSQDRVYLADHIGSYGTISSGATVSCQAMSDCFQFEPLSPRPTMHWDVSILEYVPTSNNLARWVFHIGESFSDVPLSAGNYVHVETMLHHGITGGCGGDLYCPKTQVGRGMMAVFIARALLGGEPPQSYTDPNTGRSYDCSDGLENHFVDVDDTKPYCRHVHYIWARGIVSGCGANLYCPTDKVTRGMMAVYISVSMLNGNQPPSSYVDPVTGRSYDCSDNQDNYFQDVPDSKPNCAHVHYLWAKGVIAGCGSSQYCPTDLVTRGQMAVYIVNGFQLGLYP